ncbi:MAG: Holliday junction branch migration protein RuvA [Planctomycetes bacterium]|nr:Holliday junction branch migration protein RuvA [Planctomycetota bacterium]
MYDHLVGEVCEASPARVVLRAGGVGYELKVPMSTSSALRVGDTAMLHTILHVVDGNPTLLGFRSAHERALTRRLMTVTGIGPAIALAMLSTYGPVDIANAILNGDAAMLQRVKGVGAKTAERLCLELRDHVAALDLGPGAQSARPEPGLDDDAADAVGALVTLGYTEKDARSRVERASAKLADASTEDLIKAVLRG